MFCLAIIMSSISDDYISSSQPIEPFVSCPTLHVIFTLLRRTFRSVGVPYIKPYFSYFSKLVDISGNCILVSGSIEQLTNSDWVFTSLCIIETYHMHR